MSTYPTSKLKKKLKRDYPQLVFFCLSQQNKSELVYSECSKTGEVLDKLEFELNGECGSDTELSDEEMMEEMYQKDVHRNYQFAKLYEVALLPRSCIKETAPFPKLGHPHR